MSARGPGGSGRTNPILLMSNGDADCYIPTVVLRHDGEVSAGPRNNIRETLIKEQSNMGNELRNVSVGP
jgi:hypothetical protein